VAIVGLHDCLMLLWSLATGAGAGFWAAKEFGGLLLLSSRTRHVDMPTWVVIGGSFVCLVVGGALLAFRFFVYRDRALVIVTTDAQSGVLLRSLYDPVFHLFPRAFEQALADRDAASAR